MEYGTKPAAPSESNGTAWFMLANNPSAFFSLVNTTAAGFCFSSVILIQIIVWILIWWGVWRLGVWYVNRSRVVSYNQCFVCKVGQRWGYSSEEFPVPWNLSLVVSVALRKVPRGNVWRVITACYSQFPMGVCELGHGQLEKGKTVRLYGVQRKGISLL